jgi:hypothetical protein
LPATEYNVFRSGVYFTVVHRSEDLKRTLIYRNDHRTFVTEVNFAETLEPLVIDPVYPSKTAGLLKSDVGLFMRLGKDGWDIGIEVPLPWWNEVRASCPKPLGQEEKHSAVRLVLATVPYLESQVYWETAEHAGPVREWLENRRGVLSKFDWKDAQSDGEGMYLPYFKIEHRYFTVAHDSI